MVIDPVTGPWLRCFPCRLLESSRKSPAGREALTANSWKALIWSTFSTGFLGSSSNSYVACFLSCCHVVNTSIAANCMFFSGWFSFLMQYLYSYELLSTEILSSRLGLVKFDNLHCMNNHLYFTLSRGPLLQAQRDHVTIRQVVPRRNSVTCVK